MAVRRRRRKKVFKFLKRMKKKMFVLFFIVIAVLIAFVGKLAYIELKSGEQYEKIVLANQAYDSRTIPFRRGDIVDRKGTVLATSTDVYNVILDCKAMTYKEEYIEPTIAALRECFDIDESALRDYISKNKSSQYYVLLKKLPYEQIAEFEKLQADEKTGANIQGVWFEKEYIRNYPYSTLAASLLGFTTAGNEGIGGIEDYYNATLNGTDGREYGYMNSDSNYEINVKEPVNGQTVVSSIDINLQSIVEEKIKAFNAAMDKKEGKGAKHIGVLMMDPNNGEVLAMANYPSFDLSDPWDLTKYYKEDEISAMSEDERLKALNDIWQNFCITYTYEPGSPAKPFTVAAGLETGTLKGDETYYCDGGEKVKGWDKVIKCVKNDGHGKEDIAGALSDSCNDCLMQMVRAIGAENFCKYQHIFNWGLKTNIDLPGEARTDSLIYSEEDMTAVNLATNSFGQSFNVTMIQLATAYCSLVNGGKYYQPHVVSRIEDENGNTVETVKGTLLKQTVSSETSEMITGYLKKVVEEGSGKTAKVDGYSMCGKTGTAEKLPRGSGNYLVSFIGSVPAENPKVMIYVVVDEPNAGEQFHSYFAMAITREILKEALPYLNIYPDQEKTGINKNASITGLP